MTVLDDLLKAEDDGAHTQSTRRATWEPLSARSRWAAPWLAMLAIAGVLEPFRDRWAVQVILLGWLLYAPGRLLVVVLRLRPIQVRRFPVYPIAMSLLLVMVTGLAVDGVGIVVGDDHPLRNGPLWAGTAMIYVMLVLAAAASPSHLRPSPARPEKVRAYWILALPLLAAAGAERLNAGRGSAVALVAMYGLVAIWLIRPFLRGFTWRTASLTVFAVSLASCWSFSLRGSGPYGYDILTEYAIGHATVTDGVWHLHHVNDAYGSLLSVTILPVGLHSIAGVGLLAIYKAVLPAVFAFVPVGLFRLAGRLLNMRWAYGATGILIGQIFFTAGLPAVTRQEVAFVFVITLAAALFERRGRASASILSSVCAIGLVISHYSSSYMAVVTIGTSALVLLISAAFGCRGKSLLTVVLTFIVLTVSSALWYQVLTHSASNLSSAEATLSAHGFDLLPNRTGGLLSTLVNGNVGANLSPSEYQRLVAHQYTVDYPFIRPYPGVDRHPITPAAPLTSSGPIGAIGTSLVSLFGQIVNVFAGIGSVILLLGRRSRRPILRLFGTLGLGNLLFLVIIRLSGSLAQSYNLERAQLQGYFVLLPIAVWTLWRFVAHVAKLLSVAPKIYISREYVRRGTTVAVLGISTVLLANSVGLLSDRPAVDGRGNLSANGEDVARFVPDREDLIGAEWLTGANPGLREITYADAYGKLRLTFADGGSANVFPDITPATLNREAWIYEYTVNTTEQRQARATFNGRSVIYQFPQEFVDLHFDRVYTNGRSQVFHR